MIPDILGAGENKLGIAGIVRTIGFGQMVVKCRLIGEVSVVGVVVRHCFLKNPTTSVLLNSFARFVGASRGSLLLSISLSLSGIRVPGGGGETSNGVFG